MILLKLMPVFYFSGRFISNCLLSIIEQSYQKITAHTEEKNKKTNNLLKRRYFIEQ